MSGVITKKSNSNFEQTYSKLIDAINNNPNLKVIAELDHSVNAVKVGLDLPPTRVIIFGNPSLGTHLMQINQCAALDLPQKFLVAKDENGVVSVSYNDPLYLKDRHDIEDKDHILDKIRGALNVLSDLAVGSQVYKV